MPGFRRVLLTTGTREPRGLPPLSLLLSNGDTIVECQLPQGRSNGVWPRLSLVRVDEFFVVIDERDNASGHLDNVAAAYGFSPRDVVIAGGRAGPGGGTHAAPGTLSQPWSRLDFSRDVFARVTLGEAR